MGEAIPNQGAQVLPQGVQYTIWAPRREKAAVQIFGSGNQVLRTVPLQAGAEGHFSGLDAQGKAGDRFKFAVDEEPPFPAPGSRAQPEGVHGPSLVVGPGDFPWTDGGWRRPPFRDLIIYELHLGTFTPEGTYRAAIEKLPYLRDLGITALEIMPVADFPGERGWGYDGVQPYAPARCYGTPDDFRALIDAAHAHGLAVLLDVVYNHFGPDGNYITAYSQHYFSAEDKTPWGDAINFGHEHSAPVRRFFAENPVYWMEEFHVDGFRLDATHAIIDHSPKHILQEMAETVQARGGYIIAEDERNEALFLRSRAEDGFGFNAVWADDFHHTVEVATIKASVYRQDFEGTLAELVRALSDGWIYSGQPTMKRGKPRGTRADGLAPEHFVYCISNHDQVGNRALGERLNHLVKPATYRAASALLLLTPYTPLLFQGQEWAATTPFQYFTDHNEELGRLVEAGRKEEFSDAFADHALEEKFPSPQDPETFRNSTLKWEEREEAPQAGVLALYRELIRLRREKAAFRPTGRERTQFGALTGEVLAMRVRGEGEEWLVLCDLQGGHEGELNEELTQLPCGAAWRHLLSSNETRFGGSGANSYNERTTRFRFSEPEVLVLRADTSAN